MTRRVPAVLAAIARGWPVFPVGADKQPCLRAAHPPGHPCTGGCGRDGHGWRDATLDPDRWTAWVRRWPWIPAYGIATLNLVVLDPDTGRGTPPARVLPDQRDDEPTPGWVTDGMGVLAWIARRDGAHLAEVAGTFTVATPSGGRHLYYAGPQPLPGGRVVRCSVGYTASRVTGLGWCLDVRAVGGYVLGPGSRIRTTGGAWGVYRVLAGVDTVRPVPTVLRARLAAIGHQHPPAPAATTRENRPCTRKARGRTLGPPTVGGTGRPPVGGGVRPRFWAAAVDGELAHIAAAVAGDRSGAGAGRNATVNRAAYKLGRLVGPLHLTGPDIDAVAEQLRAAAEATGLPAREAATAVASGLAQGRANPRTLPPPHGRPATTRHRPGPDRPRGRADPTPGPTPATPIRTTTPPCEGRP